MGDDREDEEADEHVDEDGDCWLLLLPPKVVLANAAQRDEDEKDKLRGEEADDGAADEDGEELRDE